MNAQLLIDNIVRQTTVLVAQLATSRGLRAPLAHVADQVFLELAACPAGQTEGELGSCLTPEGEPASVPVQPQLASRPAERHVICSCRCDGPDRDADYCSCPSGMQCEELIAGRSDRADDYTGSYCTYPTAAEPLSGPGERPGSP